MVTEPTDVRYCIAELGSTDVVEHVGCYDRLSVSPERSVEFDRLKDDAEVTS